MGSNPVDLRCEAALISLRQAQAHRRPRCPSTGKGWLRQARGRPARPPGPRGGYPAGPAGLVAALPAHVREHGRQLGLRIEAEMVPRLRPLRADHGWSRRCRAAPAAARHHLDQYSAATHPWSATSLLNWSFAARLGRGSFLYFSGSADRRPHRRSAISSPTGCGCVQAAAVTLGMTRRPWSSWAFPASSSAAARFSACTWPGAGTAVPGVERAQDTLSPAPSSAVPGLLVPPAYLGAHHFRAVLPSDRAVTAPVPALRDGHARRHLASMGHHGRPLSRS